MQRGAMLWWGGVAASCGLMAATSIVGVLHGPQVLRGILLALSLMAVGAKWWIWFLRRRFRRPEWRTPRLGLAVCFLGANRPLLALVQSWERDLEAAWLIRLTLSDIHATTQRIRIVFVPCFGLRPWGRRLAGFDDGATAIVGYRELRDSDNRARPDWTFTRAQFLHEVSHLLATHVLGTPDAGAHHALFRDIRLGA